MLQTGRKSCAEPILCRVLDLCAWRQDLPPLAPEARSRRDSLPDCNFGRWLDGRGLPHLKPPDLTDLAARTHWNDQDICRRVWASDGRGIAKRRLATPPWPSISRPQAPKNPR